MITTKAYITKVPDEGSNIFSVNVPLMADNVNEEAIFDALLATTPGSYNDFKVGDCVFVTFEDDKYNIAIIIGKLFVDVPKENNAYGLFDQLNVTGSVTLPEDTHIGRYTPQDIFNLYQGVNNGTGGGSINPDDLKEYVQWTITEREVLGEVEEIYADHIRVMNGREYDEYIKSEDYDEDLFNHTLYFLSSLPGSEQYIVVDVVKTLEDLLNYDTKNLTDGDVIKVQKDEHYKNTTQYYKWDLKNTRWENVDSGWSPDPSGDHGQQFDPPKQEQYSFESLVKKLESRARSGWTPDYSAHDIIALNVDVITININDLLLEDRTGGGTYIYFQHFGWLEPAGQERWRLIHKYLINNPPSGKGAGNWMSSDWENLDSSEKLKIGDIVTFVDVSGNPIYVAVYAGNDNYYGGNYVNNRNSAKCVKLTKTEIENSLQFADYKITRVTQSLINRHKGSPINTEPTKYSVSIKITPSDSAEVSGIGWYEKNQTVTLSITPKENYAFDSWLDGGTSSTRDITVTGDVVYTAILNDIDEFPYDAKIARPISGKIDFLYTSDMHSGWHGFGCTRFGNDSKKTFSLSFDQKNNVNKVGGDFKEYQEFLKANSIPTYLLDCGDWSNGFFNPSAERNTINTAITTMQNIGYFAVTTGNWEYKRMNNYTTSLSACNSIVDRMKDKGLVSCNIVDSSNNVVYKGNSAAVEYLRNKGHNIDGGFKAIKVGNKKIGLIAISYPSPNGTDFGSFSSSNYWWDASSSKWHDSAKDATSQNNGTISHEPKGCLYGDVQRIIDALKAEKFDYIIAFGHMDKYTDENYWDDERFYSRADFLLRNTTGLNVFIPGHRNFDIPETIPVTWKDGVGVGVVAPEAGGTMMSFGRLEIDLQNDTITCKLLNDLSHLGILNINDIHYVEKGNRP